MTATASKTYTDEERVELQRECVKEHVRLENDRAIPPAEKWETVRPTFVEEGAFYDVAPGLGHMTGLQGVGDFYDMLFSVFPDIHIDMTHTYDVPGCCVREGVVTGTHSAEFAGYEATQKRIVVPFAAMYLFGEDPTRLIAERAYWDNDGIFKQMRGEETPSEKMPWADAAA